jgi:hypothetical protein
MALPQVPEIMTPVDRTAEESKYNLAVIIDNTVYAILGTDGQSAARFLAQPTFVQVDKNLVTEGDIYDPATGTFSTPTV